MRGRFLAAGLFVAQALAATAAMAAEEHSGGGMPQLDATKFAPQLIWLAIAFGVLYLLMAKVALPRVADVLETRADHINDDLRRAEEARAEAEAVMQAYEQALAAARAKAQGEAKAAEEAAATLSEARQKEVGAVLAREAADVGEHCPHDKQRGEEHLRGDEHQRRPRSVGVHALTVPDR